jgi:hypothetical protein
MNAAMPRGLYWAQVGLYLWAAYDVVWTGIAVWAGDATGATMMESVLFALIRSLAAYGVSNEGKWGYWLGLIVCTITTIPALNTLVHEPSSLLHPDFLLLLVLPISVFFGLLDASSRDYERTWFR